eukprot:820608-Pelagomonas_calceolata.AAC.1
MLVLPRFPCRIFRGFEVQAAEGLEGSGCPQSPRGGQESSDLPSLARKTLKSNSTHTLLYPNIFI